MSPEEMRQWLRRKVDWMFDEKLHVLVYKILYLSHVSLLFIFIEKISNLK